MESAHECSELIGLSTMLFDGPGPTVCHDSVGLSVTEMPPFDAWRGSILVPTLFHFASNIPRWPHAHLYDNCPIVVVGVIVIRTNCRTMLAHERAISDIMKPDHEAQTSP